MAKTAQSQILIMTGPPFLAVRERRTANSLQRRPPMATPCPNYSKVRAKPQSGGESRAGGALQGHEVPIGASRWCEFCACRPSA
jgi:hypothetical protein